MNIAHKMAARLNTQLDPTNLTIQQIKNGNAAIFKSLFDTFYKRLCHFAWRILGDQDEAEDIVQEVFVRLWQNRQELEITRSINAYLHQCVKNACLNQIKHKKVKLTYAQNATSHPHQSADYNDTEMRELQALIEINIHNLPAERKKIFIMSRKNGLKHKEIAEKLGISVKTVENQIGQALKYFREVLQDYLPWFIFLIWMVQWKEILF